MYVSKQIPKLNPLFLLRILKAVSFLGVYVRIKNNFHYVNVKSNNCCWAYSFRYQIPNGWKQLLMGCLEVYSSEVRNNKHGLSNDISEQEIFV